MSKHLRVLRVFADGRPRKVMDVYQALPHDAHLGSVCKDLVLDGRLVREADGWRITRSGLDRLARSYPPPRDSDA